MPRSPASSSPNFVGVLPTLLCAFPVINESLMPRTPSPFPPYLALSRSRLTTILMSSNTYNPQSNYQSIIDALTNYADQTGIELSNNPFANKLLLSDSPEAILELFHDRERSFKGYLERNRKLINCLTPVVQILHIFCYILGESVSIMRSTVLVPCTDLNHTSRCLSHHQRQSLLVSMFCLPCVLISSASQGSSDVFYVRPLMVSAQVMTLCWTSSSASGISFNVSLFILSFPPLPR